MQARLDVMLLDEKGRVVAVHAGVTLSAAIALGEEFLRARGTDGGRVTIDGNDVTHKLLRSPAPAPTQEPRDAASITSTSAYQFILTDDNVLHRLPLADMGAGDPTLRPGPGPGGLQWQPIEDHGMTGLSAPGRRGTFKILRLASGHCALLHERGMGDLEALALGEPDALKARAGERANDGPPRPAFDPAQLRAAFRLGLFRWTR